MSDLGRKNFGEQAQEKITPDSQKSYTNVAGENLSGAYDKVAGAVQPNSEKSTTQKLGDSTRSGADSAQKDGKTYAQQATDAAGNLANVAADKAKAASDYVAGTANSKTN